MNDEKEATAGESAWLCSKCSKPSPRLEEAPFPTNLGEKIHAEICQPCWKEWMATSVMVINEYRLNLMSPEGGKVYDAHMCEFLGLKDG